MKKFIFLLFTFFSYYTFACHTVTITETNAVDNGDGTYTYTFDICVGIEDTYGFYFNFTGGNLIGWAPNVTGPSTGNTINASVPPISGSGDIEYGNWDSSGGPLFSGLSGDCVSMSFTFDDPISSASFDGTQAFYSGGPCGGSTSTNNFCDATTADYLIVIDTDNYGSETSWEITDQTTGAQVATGSGYSSNSTYNIPVCVPDGCYDFTIYDSWGDGMCCSLGNGSYEVYDNAGNLLCSGGAFGSSETNDIGCPTSLPIELLSFTGKAEDDRNFIEWDVLTEINCDYYIVEHSTNFVSWTEVGEVDGVGTTSNEQHYFLYDNRPVNSINYYRLKQVDMNGEFKFYGPIVVNRTSDNSDRVLINKTNLLGQKVSDDFEGQIILFYSDGTKEISLNQ